MRLALVTCVAAMIGCSNSVTNAEAPFDAGAPDVVVCDPGPSLVSDSDDCVALTDSSGCAFPNCAARQAYACNGGQYSISTPLGAVAGPNDTACAVELACARAKRYDARCSTGDAGDAGGEAYSCALIPDGGGYATVNTLNECFPLDAAAPPGEFPIVCCP